MSAVDAPDRPDIEEERPAWRRRPISLGIVAVFLVAALLSLGLAIFSPHTDHPGHAPRPAQPRTPGVSDSACGLPNGDQTIPQTTPADTTWQFIGSIAAPTDPAGLGPARRSTTGLPYCYAHSPTGALYAAANFLAAASNPALRRAAAQQLTAPGPGHDTLVQALAGPDQGGAGGGLQVAGFVYVSYAPQAAAIDLLLTYTDGAGHRVLERWPAGLLWQRGDWRLQLPDDGQPFAPNKHLFTIDNSSGYAPWAGAR